MVSTDTAFIVFDTESVVDGALLRRVLYPGEELSDREAVARHRAELAKGSPEREPFVAVTFHVPIAIAVARVGPDFRLQDIACLDAPRFDPQAIVDLFWRGLQHYRDAVIVDFNGRGFDIPLLTLSAFRFGISCRRYFGDPDRFGFRYRFTAKHIDLMEWMTEYGAFRLKGGLNLLAKLLGKPGKMETTGAHVETLFREGRVGEINDYCMHDVLDTYFVFLRTRVLAGELSLQDEQKLVSETKTWLEGRRKDQPALTTYLESFGTWDPRPFVGR